MRSIAIRWGLAALGVTALSTGVASGAAGAQARRAGTSVTQANEATSTSVTITPAPAVSGQAVRVSADVSFTRIKHSPINGTVTFSATNKLGAAVALNCKAVTDDVAVVHKNGVAFCDVPAATLFASQGPYTITAAYSGSTDGNFDASTGSTTYSPAVAPTTIRIKLSPFRPSSDSAETVTATVMAGPGTAGLYGDVVFVVTSGDHKVTPECTNSTAKSHEEVPLTGNTATCDVPAGWLMVPAPSTTDKHPKTDYAIVAQFSGNGDYQAPIKAASKTGKAKQ